MAQEDQTERGLSSFANEIEDIKVILQASNRHCLTLIDEFSNRFILFYLYFISTSIECGLALSWSLLEYFSSLHSIYCIFTTHHSSVNKLLFVYTSYVI